LAIPPEFKLIGRNNGVVTLIQQFCPVDRLVTPFVAIAFVYQHSSGHAQSNMTVDAAAFGSTRLVLGPFVVLLQAGDLVAEELCRLASRVSDERLFLREFSLESVAQEFFEALFDLLGFGFGADKSQNEIISVPAIPESAVGGVMGVLSRELLRLPSYPLGSLLLPVLEGAVRLTHQLFVGFVDPSFVTLGVLRDEHLFNKLVELVQQDIGENGADNGPLGYPAERPIELPLLQVACIKQSANQPQKSSILDALTQRSAEHLVI
jgi:hypothetical protein